MPEISPKAIVENAAAIAADARVGPFSYVGPDVRIGPGCIIDNNVTLVGKTTLGSRTHVFPMAVVGAAPPTGDDAGECILGEANAVREHVTVYAGTDSPTRIGNDNLIMIGSQIGSGATIGDHGIFDNCCRIGAGTIIEDYVRMSGFAAVAAGATVGAYSFVAGYAGVMSNAPPYAMLQGLPARVRGVNTRNLKRCGFGEDDIHALKEAFRELFNGPDGEVNEEALSRIEAAGNPNPHVRKLIGAVRRATGVARGRAVDD